MPIRTLIIIFLAVATLAGCGRKGLLEAPPPKPVAAPPLSTGPAEPAMAPAAAPAPAGPRRFFLDFLL